MMNKPLPTNPAVPLPFPAPSQRKDPFARYRKWVSRVVAAAFVALALLTVSPGTPIGILVTEVIGIILVITAALGRVWCALYIAGRKNAELCEDGPYSLCRNPLYLFSFLGVTGLILAARLVPLALLFAPIFWAYHYRVIRSEEKALASIFGSAYARYREDVPRLWPRFSRFHSRTSLTVDPRKITRAISEVAWFLIALGCLEIVEHMRGASLGDASLPVVFAWPF